MALGTGSFEEVGGEHVQHAHDEFGGILRVVLEIKFAVPGREAGGRPGAMGGRAGAAGAWRTGGLVWGVGVEAGQGRTSVGWFYGYGRGSGAEVLRGKWHCQGVRETDQAARDTPHANS